ncbi:MAG: NAD(P)H-dependent glycerol-3-phosphate dehydrogenase [Candidatus Anammoxibacter sp.]
MKEKILIVGNGGWGTALAILLQKKGHNVVLWGHTPEYVEYLKDKRENIKFLKGITLPKELELTSDLSVASEEISLLVSATPSLYLRKVIEKLKPFYVHGTKIVSVTKGIETGSFMRATEIITDVLQKQPIAVLSGPSHAEEVAQELPTTVVVSATDPELAKYIQNVFFTDRFRVYTNNDVIGVELGGATKNVIAIAAGICAGLKFGDNTKAALVTRGLAEATRLGIAMGAREDTFRGLAGIGDLITTCVSPYGRNLRLGENIGKGSKLSDILNNMDQVAEGVLTTKSVSALADKYNVDMPITKEIYKVLFEDKDPLKAVNDLMMRTQRSEIDK